MKDRRNTENRDRGEPVSRRRLSSFSRFVVAVTVVSVAVGIFPGIASAVTPGSQMWLKLYNGSANGSDQATALEVSSDSSKVFVTGESAGSHGYDYNTVAYEASTGARLWIKRYNGPGNGLDKAAALAVTTDGSKVFVTGQSRGTTTGYDYATVAYDASTGTELWLRRYNGPGNARDSAIALKVSPDGSVLFVTGSSAGSGTGRDYATVAYGASTGATLWANRYAGPNGADSATALGVSPDGADVFVTGYSTASVGNYGYDYATLAYDEASGVELWQTLYNGPGNSDDAANSLGVSLDGTEVFVTGGSDGLNFYEDYATVAYDTSTGNQLWLNRYNGSANYTDSATALRLSPDGSRVFVTGISTGSSSGWDYLTVAYDAFAGTKLWVRRYSGAGNSPDEALALGVSPDGTKVFVTGYSTGSNGSYDYATAAYGATSGTKLWVQRYNGAGNGKDVATGLGVSPDGTTVFITGWSAGSTSHFDYATIAYLVG